MIATRGTKEVFSPSSNDHRSEERRYHYVNLRDLPSGTEGYSGIPD